MHSIGTSNKKNALWVCCRIPHILSVAVVARLKLSVFALTSHGFSPTHCLTAFLLVEFKEINFSLDVSYGVRMISHLCKLPEQTATHHICKDKTECQS